jgi:hypothetical protein
MSLNLITYNRRHNKQSGDIFNEGNIVIEYYIHNRTQTHSIDWLVRAWVWVFCYDRRSVGQSVLE